MEGCIKNPWECREITGMFVTVVKFFRNVVEFVFNVYQLTGWGRMSHLMKS